MSTVVRLRRSIVIFILVVMFGMLGVLAWFVADLHGLHAFDARRNYDICIGANRRVERIVEKLTENTPPDRREQLLMVVRETQSDCDIYKVNP